MSITPASSHYARFIDPSLRERLVGSLQRDFGKRVGSDEVEDAYGHMLEQLSKMTVDDLAAVQNPATWMFVGMRNRLHDRLRLRSSSNVHFGDLANGTGLEELLFDDDDVVAGSVIGRETAGERLAQVAELVWLKFTGADGQIAARILLEEAKPKAVAAELGLDPAYVSTVAHKAHQEQRLLERKLKENPEFRCWRLRKHTSNYYANGDISLALRAHWVTCAKCRAAQRVAREHTYAALNPLLPGTVTAAVGGGLFARLLHHAGRPARLARRALRPAGHAGANAGASSTQVVTAGATVTSKAAVIATVAVIGTAAAGATTVAAVRHFAHHATHRALAHRHPGHAVAPSPEISGPPTPAAVPPGLPRTTTSHRTHMGRHAKRATKHAEPHSRAKHTHHRATKDVVSSEPVTETATAPPATTTTTQAPPVTTAQAPPAAHTPAPTSPSTGGSVTNPSYSTPNAP